MADNIWKVAQLHNERDDTWYDVYEADAVGSGCVRVEVPRDVREPGNVRRHLLKKGADVSDLDHAKGNLILAIQSDAPVIHRAASVGWRNDRFVGYNYVVGCDDGTVLPPLTSHSTANVHERGTLVEWQELIDCTRFSTTMTVSLCAGFAGPMMRLLNCPSFGLVLVGPSRCAKSTSQLVGASVYGFGFEEHLPTPNATSAGLLETASHFNDHMFPLNELGAAAGGKAEKYAAVSAMTYAFTGGQDTIRHSSWSGSSSLDFKVLVLMSSEISPDEWAARAGDTRDPGETARLIGVSALHGGNPTVFDTFPPMPKLERPAWTEQQLSRLRVGLPTQRGVALRMFLRALTATYSTFVAHAKEDVVEFHKAMEEFATSRIARDIIGKFAVIYAGGFAACDAKVLPFHSDVVYQAVRKACLAALQSLPDPEANLRYDLMALRRFLENPGVIDADEASTRQKRNMEHADGYFEKSDLGRTYTMRAVDCMKIFPTVLRGLRVLEWLDSEGNLRHQREHKVGLSTEWAQTQVTWPSGHRFRCFVLYFPAGLKVLEKV